jgi:metal-responsive CopG/Arc/MetJ family transcriptional regulator
MAKSMQMTIDLEAEDLAILEAIQEQRGLFSRAQALRYALRRYAELMRISTQNRPSPRG